MKMYQSGRISGYWPSLLPLCTAVLTLFHTHQGVRAQSEKELTEIVTELRAKHGVPALGAAIVTDDQTVVAVAGTRKSGDPTPALRNDKFHLGSCTKAMTATLAAMLIEKGKLRWNTTLAEVFPELSATMQPAYRKVTIRQLLQHRGGFSEESFLAKFPFIYWYQSTLPVTEQRLQYLKHVLREAPVTPPGGKWVYSNRGYIVAGAMLERLTQRSWETLMQEYLFKPLKMHSAGFGPTTTKSTPIEQPWPHIKENGQLKPLAPETKPDNPLMLGPAGTVHCSLEDWAKFVRFHLRGARGDEKLLSAAAFRILHETPQDSEYAAGWIVTDRTWGGGKVLTHAGTNTMNYAVNWLAPLRKFGVLVVTNSGEGAEVCDQVSTVLVLHQFVLHTTKKQP